VLLPPDALAPMTVPAPAAPIRTQHNFSGGPGALPDSVLREASQAILEVPGERLSVLGISHRSRWFRNVVDEAEDNIRALLGVPNHYRILFLQGGATLQFSMIAMTLLRGSAHAAEYLHTGYWSGKAVAEAVREGPVKVLRHPGEGFRALPDAEQLTAEHSPHAPYVHYISNETVEGLQFHRKVGRDDVLRVCDMSSDFLSRPVPIEDFALVYAHAQKNIGPAGVTVAVIRDDIVARVPEGVPGMMDYREHVRMGSVYNTPPVFAIYVTMLVTRWLRQEMGGLAAIAAVNRAKAAALYAVLDASPGFYRPHAAVADRSLMNVTFRLPDAALERRFLDEALAAGLHGLDGHRSLGGIRASLYNAVSPLAVDALCTFMHGFRANHQQDA
jgi:phosphoserine aminotransferase